MKASKYRNIPTEIDGIRFASKKEARRYSELKLLERARAIHALEIQPRYPLKVNGLPVCTYVADFAYFDSASGSPVTEDVKGMLTPEFKLKAKLFNALYGREIAIV